MYAALDKGDDALRGIKAPKSWTDQEAMEGWVRDCVAGILGREVDIVGDLFQQGMDRSVLAATVFLYSH